MCNLKKHLGTFLKLCLAVWLLAGVLATAIASAELPPQGKFQCRHYEDGGSGVADPVAYLWLHPNGTYDILDLTTRRGKTSGHYRYDSKKQQIDWTSGDWARFVGRYLPHIDGAAAITVNTRKDPEGRVDGTLPCVQVPEKGSR